MISRIRRRPALLLIAILLALVSCACRRNPRSYFETGNKMAAQGRYDDAELNFRKAIQKDQNFGEAYYQLGLLEIRRHNNMAAYGWLRGANGLLPDRDDVASQFSDIALGLYLTDRRHPAVLFDQVTAQSDKMLAKNAASFDGLRLKGMLAAAGNHFADAEDFFERANAVKPSQPQLVLAWTEALFADGKTGHDKAAETLATQLIAREKTYPPIYGVLVRYYNANKRAADAERILKLRVANNPADAAAAIDLASFYGANSRDTEMRAVLEGMLARPRDFPNARIPIGDLYVKLKRWDDAMAQYRAGAQSVGGTPDGAKQRIVYLKRIVNVWLAQDQAQNAYAAAAEILRQDPHDESALTVQASLLLSTRNPANVTKAVSMLRDLAAKDAGNASLHFDLGRALLASGDTQAARGEFRQAIQLRPAYIEPRLTLIEMDQSKGDYREALDYADQALKINPGLSAVRLVRAASLMHAGNEAQGRAELDALAREFPGNREVRLQIALADLRGRRFQAAEDQFRKLAETSAAGDIRPLKGMADVLTAEGETAKALALLEEDLRKSPGDLRVRSLLASTALAARNYDVAVEQYRQLTTAVPRSAPFALALSHALEAKGDSGGALTWAQKARDLAPTDSDILDTLGDILAASNRASEALGSYRAALSVHPDDAAALSGAASAIAGTGGNIDEALKMAERAVRLDSSRPDYDDTLGSIYLKKKYTDAAAQVFRGLTEKFPDNPVYRYHFALALLEQGDRNGAKSELTSALAANPAAGVRSQIEGALSRAGS